MQLLDATGQPVHGADTIEPDAYADGTSLNHPADHPRPITPADQPAGGGDVAPMGAGALFMTVFATRLFHARPVRDMIAGLVATGLIAGLYLAWDFLAPASVPSSGTLMLIGIASAMAWILALILLGLTLVMFRTAPRWVYYEAE